MISLIAMTPEMFFYYLAWAGAGQLASVLQQQVKYAPRIQNEGGFRITTWILDNWKRVVLTLLIMSIGILLYDKIFKDPLDELNALLAGAFVDRTWDMITNRKK